MKNLFDLNFFEERSDLPLSHTFIVDSGVPGPTLVVLGAVHGNEPAGVKASIELTEEIESGNYKLQNGKIVFILGNPKAYAADSRFVEENLNRTFGENIKETLESKRAKAIKDFVLSLDNVTGLIDLHSVSIGNFQMVVYPNLPGNTEFALKMSNLATHFCFLPKLVVGTSCEILSVRPGTKSLCVECGNHNDPESSQIALRHIKNFLEDLGMVQATTQIQSHSEPITVYRTLDLIRPTIEFQFLNPSVQTGLHLEAGEVYAQDVSGPIFTETECYIVMPTKVPDPTDSDAGFLCSREIYSTSNGI